MHGQALRDPLTGLWSRATFDHDLSEQVRLGRGTLLLCDLDHLKLINDTYGHLAGDQALQRVAAALQTCPLPEARAYRLGGDEFALLCDAPLAQVHHWAQQLLEHLRLQPGRTLGLSLGAASLSAPADAAALPLTALPLELAVQHSFEQADRRLYQAKRQGRGRLVTQDDPEPPAAGGGRMQRLLERDEARQQLMAALEEAGNRRLQVRVTCRPGDGLSAFLEQIEVLAQGVGFRTVRLQGHPLRACRELGAWSTLCVDGQAVELSPAQLGGVLQDHDRLAVLLDDPEGFDPHTWRSLAPVLDRARLLLTGEHECSDRRRAAPPPGVWTDAPISTTVRLPPLGDLSIRLLIEHSAEAVVGMQAQEWLIRCAAGSPSALHDARRALLLEARLRHQTPEEIVTGPPDGLAAVARHISSLRRPDFSSTVRLPYLYGRVEQMREGLRLWHRWPLLTVTGPPQRGRSRLARQLAGEQAQLLGAALHEVSLAGSQSAEAALSQLLSSLLGYPVPHADPGVLRRVLGRQPTVLLLDKLRPSTVLLRLLEELLEGLPDVRLLVTAATPLGLSQEAVLTVPPLRDDEVQSALQSLWLPHPAPRAPLPPDRPASQEPDCRALDELVAAVEGEPQRLMSLLDTVQTLGLGEALSQAGRIRDSSAADRTFPDLGPSERRVLAALSVFAGPFSLSWASEVGQVSPFLLGALLNRWIIQPAGPGLLRLSEAARRAGHSHLNRTPALRRQAEQRALARTRQILARFPSESRAWLMEVGEHYPVLRSVMLEQLHGRRTPTPDTLELVRQLWPYQVARGYLYDARDDLQAALRHLEHGGPSVLRSALHLGLAQVYQHLGDHDQAQALAEEVHCVSGQQQWPQLQAWSTLLLGRILHRRSQYEQARTLYQRGEQLGAALQEPVMISLGLAGWARASIYLGDLDSAWTTIRQTLSLTSTLDRPLLHARALNTAALIASEQRRLDEAAGLLEEALSLQEQYGGQGEQVLNMTALGWVALLRGEAGRSADLSRRVLRQAQDVGQTWEVGNALTNLGHATARLGQLDTAWTHHSEAARLARRCDAPSLLAETLGGLADVLWRRGQPCLAQQVLTLALHHPGANQEVRHFFEPLRLALLAAWEASTPQPPDGSTPLQPLPGELAALLQEVLGEDAVSENPETANPRRMTARSSTVS